MASSSPELSSIEAPKLKEASCCYASCFLLLSATNYQTPPVHPILRPISQPYLGLQPELLQKSLISAVQNCFRTLGSFLAENPFLGRILSLRSEFENVCREVRCRNFRSLNPLMNHNFAAVLPGDSLAGLVVANGVLNFLNIYNTLLVVRLVLTWFPNVPPAIVSPLSTLCDPYLNIFRGIIPPLGGTLDLSPILAFLVLNAFTSTASALPAELPENTHLLKKPLSSPTGFTNLTISQEKWLRRIIRSKPNRPRND
ncbi:hypothetical protein SAY87_015047 [Trapa incisa]|uniref:YGGT family protein n=2 Tax=Trapa TaxID=22665 RepID=A0AAN7RLE5_TRANT|nr:hypothetical protein SAY87_015047 [Trapa incisa]KAK4802216.1 hypothetical protein SAY86_000419 [Trapa natans]